MRRTLALAAVAVSLAAAPAFAKPDPSVVPICDLEGHCDRRCTFEFPPDPRFYCGW